MWCRLRLASAIGVLAVVLAVTLAPGASRAIPGPTAFGTGVVDETMFHSPDPATRTTWLVRARSLGSSWIRLRANWDLIAPARRPRGFRASDPHASGYSWTSLDASIRSADGAHQHVLLQLIAPPAWALGAHAPRSAWPGTWKPQPAAVGAFARALAVRYSGHFTDPLQPGRRLPHVSAFQIWNEPNLRRYLSPQWTRRRHGGWVAASPVTYRSMLNAAYANIKAIQHHAIVLAAGTAPYGDPPGVERMTPVTFWRELLCLHGPAMTPERCPHPAHLDGLDHHPYGLTPTRHAANPEDVGVPDLGRLTRILRTARRRHRIRPAGPKSVWVTELDWDANPPDRNAQISQSTQARYLALAFYELWRQGVGHVLWFLIRDVPSGVLTGAGLYLMSGAAKPVTGAFRFPFVAVPAGRSRLVLWGRAPHRGTVTISERMHRRWHSVRRVTANRGGVFFVRVSRSRPALMRAQQGPITSPGFGAR